MDIEKKRRKSEIAFKQESLLIEQSWKRNNKELLQVLDNIYQDSDEKRKKFIADLSRRIVDSLQRTQDRIDELVRGE